MHEESRSANAIAKAPHHDDSPAASWLPSIRIQLVVLLVGMVIFPMLLVGWIVNGEISTTLDQESKDNGHAWVEWLGEDVRTHVDTLRSDAIQIAHYPPIEGLIRARDNADVDPLDGSSSLLWKERLEQLFHAYCAARPDIRQVRYLDETGHEWVRVDSDGLLSRTVPTDELQDKSSRYYYQEVLAIAEEKCYVSPLDLNVEFGEVTMPPTPMLRVSTPVWHEGSLRGVIVINESPVTLLQRIESARDGDLVLADTTGTYLYHRQEERQWGAQLGHDDNLYADWPELSKAVADELYLEQEDRVLVWTRLAINPDDPEHTWLLGAEWDRASFYHATTGVRRAITRTTIGLASLAAGLAMLFALWWGGPLSSLAAAARRIREGDFSTRVTTTRGDELGDLGRAFNQMAEEVGLHTASLEAEVKERTADLEHAKASAEHANRAKSTFLASMSHELRTPLNAILGFSQILERDAALSAKQKEDVNTINRCGEHLLGLINEVLEMSKIEAGQNTLSPEPVSLTDLLGDLERIMYIRAEQKRLDLIFNVEPSLCEFVRIDAKKLRQVLINLIGNAIKFTREGSVTVVASGSESEGKQFAKFEVIDTGDGISEEDQQHLFDAFVRLDEANNSEEGTGLGLAISNNFVNLLGGNLQVNNVSASGTCFSFEIPVNACSAEDALSAPIGKVATLKPGTGPIRVLVAEDNELNSRVLHGMLTEIGLECAVAKDGEEAVRLSQSWRPDLILMDMRMPVMDGYEATRSIKSAPETADTPVIAVSASVFEQERAAMAETGCIDFIPKPLDRREVYRKLAKYLDIEFDYEDGDGATTAKTARVISDPEQIQRLFEAVPHQPLEALEAGLRDIDPRTIAKAVEALEAGHPELAAYIRRQVERFRYDDLLKSITGTKVTK